MIQLNVTWWPLVDRL